MCRTWGVFRAAGTGLHETARFSAQVKVSKFILFGQLRATEPFCSRRSQFGVEVWNPKALVIEFVTCSCPSGCEAAALVVRNMDLRQLHSRSEESFAFLHRNTGRKQRYSHRAQPFCPD